MLNLYLILFFMFIYWVWHRRHIYELSLHLPGPIGLPIFGSVFSVINPRNVQPFLSSIAQKYTSPMRIWFGTNVLVFIADAENAEIILKSKDCLDKPDLFYNFLRDTLGIDGILTSNTEEWKIHRRYIAPAIGISSSNAHLPVINQHIRTAMSQMPIGHAFFDILEPLVLCKMNIFVEASLGSDWEPHIKEMLLRHLSNGFEIASKRLFQPLYHINFIWNLTKYSKRLQESLQFARSVFEKAIEGRLGSSNSNGVSILEKLLSITQEDPEFTLEHVFMELGTILVGATDTTAAASAFAAVMLAMHPEHQEAVFQEIYRLMPTKDMDLTQIELDQLPFTDMCIRETLRLFPTGSVIARVARKPIRLNNCLIPANVPLVVGIRQIQMQPMYYGANANLFDPYRFKEETIKNLPHAAFIPFSYGPRNCVGYHYGKMTLKCTIVHLIRNFHLTTSYKCMEDLKLVQSITMRLQDKHMVQLKPRTQ